MADCYLTAPDDGEGSPPVLFIIDAIGLRDRTKEMADRIAAEGYTVRFTAQGRWAPRPHPSTDRAVAQIAVHADDPERGRRSTRLGLLRPLARVKDEGDERTPDAEREKRSGVTNPLVGLTARSRIKSERNHRQRRRSLNS
jgi:dienelactone hydrolase